MEGVLPFLCLLKSYIHDFSKQVENINSDMSTEVTVIYQREGILGLLFLHSIKVYKVYEFLQDALTCRLLIKYELYFASKTKYNRLQV
jgi:hypothetical protein